MRKYDRRRKNTRWICCPLCDKKKCERDAEDCDVKRLLKDTKKRGDKEMSGGSYCYIYSRLKQECDGRMYDEEMNEMITDLCEVLHDLEWWQSSDYSEDTYRAILIKFKTKWFSGNRKERLKGYIDEQIGIVRKQLYALIGETPQAESEG